MRFYADLRRRPEPSSPVVGVAETLLGLLGPLAACALVALGPVAERASGQDLGARIQVAVERGRVHLLPRLAAQVDNPGSDYPMGRIALPLAAVLKAGTPPDDETVQRALAKLETLSPSRTYSVACYLFALDAYWQSRYRASLARRDPRRGATAVGETVPNLPPEGPIRHRMKELVDWLVRGQGGTWNYGGRGRGDHSNSQFAILGLDIGLQNEIPIPTEVFRAIAQHFVDTHASTSDSEQFTITYKTPEWEGVTTGVVRRTAFVGYLGGWDYQPERSGQKDTMTAAGVSSLLVARRALQRAGEHTGNLAWEVDRKIEAGLGWIARNWGTYLRQHRWAYYGLYSVEKVGDIGGILSFGSVNWYSEGAKHIVAKQRPDGGWGDDVDTAFALLFLTRATRSHLQTLGPPVLFTRVAPGEREGSESDLVYIEKVKGFVSAKAIFDFLSETRDPKLIPVAREAVQAYPPHRIHEVLARVVSLWSEDKDAVTKFAKESAGELVQADVRDRAELESLVRDFRRMRELEELGAGTAEEASSLLREARSPLLQRRALDFIDRLGLADAFGAVVDKLTDRDPYVRRRAYEVLQVWTSKDYPAPGDSTGSASPTGRELEEAARPWREWWEREADSFRATRRAAALLEGLRDRPDPAEAGKIVRALVDLGAPAAPAVLQAMERGEYRVELIQALEGITGKSAGVRVADWRRAIGD